jgi:hypothetical protein
MYTHFLLTLLLPLPSYPSQWCQPPSNPRQELFCPPVIWFCRRKKIKDKKKNTTFLLVCDKGGYTGSFLVILPCVCVL